jgi:hypothetical protein
MVELSRRRWRDMQRRAMAMMMLVRIIVVLVAIAVIVGAYIKVIR